MSVSDLLWAIGQHHQWSTFIARTQTSILGGTTLQQLKSSWFFKPHQSFHIISENIYHASFLIRPLWKRKKTSAVPACIETLQLFYASFLLHHWLYDFLMSEYRPYILPKEWHHPEIVKCFLISYGNICRDSKWEIELQTSRLKWNPVSEYLQVLSLILYLRVY